MVRKNMRMTQGVLWTKRDTYRLMRIVNMDGRTWLAMQADYFPDRSVASLRHRVRRINASISGVPTCRKAGGIHVQMSEEDESSDDETVLTHSVHHARTRRDESHRVGREVDREPERRVWAV